MRPVPWAHDSTMINAPQFPRSATAVNHRTKSAAVRPSSARPFHVRLLGVAALVCLAFASVSALGASTAVAAAQDNDSTLFTALGETQSATVPDGALGAFFLVEGGGGGKRYNGLGAPSSGGAGASLTGTVLLQPDDVLTINVGSQGVSNQLSAGNPSDGRRPHPASRQHRRNLAPRHVDPPVGTGSAGWPAGCHDGSERCRGGGPIRDELSIAQQVAGEGPLRRGAGTGFPPTSNRGGRLTEGQSRSTGSWTLATRPARHPPGRSAVHPTGPWSCGASGFVGRDLIRRGAAPWSGCGCALRCASVRLVRGWPRPDA
jgi:hypothetical protein